MKGQTMLAMLQWLGIAASFSRPTVKDDNPYSESLFRTLKYRPQYPRGRFAEHRVSSRVGRALRALGTTTSTCTAPSAS